MEWVHRRFTGWNVQKGSQCRESSIHESIGRRTYGVHREVIGPSELQGGPGSISPLETQSPLFDGSSLGIGPKRREGLG